MRYKFILLAFVAIVATAWAAHSATPDPAVAQTVTNAQLQSEVNVLNELINMDYSVWAAPGKYDQLRKNRRYRKIAWAQDGCSAPYQTIADVLDSIILPVCLRHDMTWRSLAVIDRATGKVWNERNRYKADTQFRDDANGVCATRYPVSDAEDLFVGCVGTMTTTYGLIRGHKYRAELTAERLDVQTKANDNNASNDGIILWGPRGLCSGPNNRCLPIHYVTRNSLPFAPQNYGFIPTGAAIELQVVRANLQSVGRRARPDYPDDGREPPLQEHRRPVHDRAAAIRHQRVPAGKLCRPGEQTRPVRGRKRLCPYRPQPGYHLSSPRPST